MKTKILFALAFLTTLVLTSPPAYASEVSGQISSSDSPAQSGSGVETGGGTRSRNANMITGTVSGGGSSFGGEAGSRRPALTDGSGQNPARVDTAPSGSVLGASTDVSNFTPSEPDTFAVADRGSIATADQGNSALVAAVDASGTSLAWWLWLLIPLILLGIGGHTYRSYRRQGSVQI